MCYSNGRTRWRKKHNKRSTQFFNVEKRDKRFIEDPVRYAKYTSLKDFRILMEAICMYIYTLYIHIHLYVHTYTYL